MSWYQILFIFIILLGAVNTVIQIFKITVLDAKSRGIKHPTFWGLLAASGQNAGGLLLYFLNRRKYPSSMSDPEKQEIASRKNKVGVGLIFLVIGTVGMIVATVLK